MVKKAHTVVNQNGQPASTTYGDHVDLCAATDTEDSCTYSGSTAMLAQGCVTGLEGVTVNSDFEQHCEAHSKMCHWAQSHNWWFGSRTRSTSCKCRVYPSTSLDSAIEEVCWDTLINTLLKHSTREPYDDHATRRKRAVKEWMQTSGSWSKNMMSTKEQAKKLKLRTK